MKQWQLRLLFLITVGDNLTICLVREENTGAVETVTDYSMFSPASVYQVGYQQQEISRISSAQIEKDHGMFLSSDYEVSLRFFSIVQNNCCTRCNSLSLS